MDALSPFSSSLHRWPSRETTGVFHHINNQHDPLTSWSTVNCLFHSSFWAVFELNKSYLVTFCYLMQWQCVHFLSMAYTYHSIQFLSMKKKIVQEIKNIFPQAHTSCACINNFNSVPWLYSLFLMLKTFNGFCFLSLQG